LAKFFTFTSTVLFVSLLFLASIKLIISEFQFGQQLEIGIPVWAAQLAFPIGYGLIIIHTLISDDLRVSQKLAIITIVGTLLFLGAQDSWIPTELSWLGFVVLLIAAAFGMPIFAVLGGIAFILFWREGIDPAAFAIEIYAKIGASSLLPSLPLFTLAGYIFAQGGASVRLVEFFRAFFGWIPGGIAVASVGVCTFFTTFTGASGVTILAMGGLLKPVMDKNDYDDKTSIGIITGSGSLGLLFPPSLPLILYSIAALQPIPDMFLGGILPGILLTSMVSAYALYKGAKIEKRRIPLNFPSIGRAFLLAKWEVSLPFLVLFVLFSGFATLVETAALTALYAFVSEFIVHRDLNIKKDFIRIFSYSSVLIGGVLIILASALGLTNYLIDAQVPSIALDFVKTHIDSPLVFLLVVNIFLLLVGFFMDSYTAIIVVSPLLIPMAQAFNINPVHMGVIFLANLGVGYLTPPVGMNLFISSFTFKKPLTEIYPSVIPILFISVVAVMIITYVPWLSTVLVELTGGLTNTNMEFRN